MVWSHLDVFLLAVKCSHLCNRRGTSFSSISIWNPSVEAHSIARPCSCRESWWSSTYVLDNFTMNSSQGFYWTSHHSVVHHDESTHRGKDKGVLPGAVLLWARPRERDFLQPRRHASSNTRRQTHLGGHWSTFYSAQWKWSDLFWYELYSIW